MAVPRLNVATWRLPPCGTPGSTAAFALARGGKGEGGGLRGGDWQGATVREAQHVGEALRPLPRADLGEADEAPSGKKVAAKPQALTIPHDLESHLEFTIAGTSTHDDPSNTPTCGTRMPVIGRKGDSAENHPEAERFAILSVVIVNLQYLNISKRKP